MSIDNVAVSGNIYGVLAQPATNAILGRSTIMGTANNGIVNSTSPNSFYTYQNNQIGLNGNGNAINGSALPMSFQ